MKFRWIIIWSTVYLYFFTFWLQDNIFLSAIFYSIFYMSNFSGKEILGLSMYIIASSSNLQEMVQCLDHPQEHSIVLCSHMLHSKAFTGSKLSKLLYWEHCFFTYRIINECTIASEVENPFSILLIWTWVLLTMLFRFVNTVVESVWKK